MFHGRPLHFDISAIGVEIGERQHRVHAHFQLLILHNGKLNQGPMQRRWQETVGRHLRQLGVTRAGVRVSMDRIDTRALNYVAKYAQSVDDILA